jgi:hypothetical protein
MPHVGCNAYVRRSDGGTAPNLVRRYGRLCADGLRGWSARVARRAGVRVRVPVNDGPSSMAGPAIGCERRGFRSRAAAPHQQQLRAPSRLRARNLAPPRGMVRRRLTPKFSRMRRRRNSAHAPQPGAACRLQRHVRRDADQVIRQANQEASRRVFRNPLRLPTSSYGLSGESAIRP